MSLSFFLMHPCFQLYDSLFLSLLGYNREENKDQPEMHKFGEAMPKKRCGCEIEKSTDGNELVFAFLLQVAEIARHIAPGISTTALNIRVSERIAPKPAMLVSYL